MDRPCWTVAIREIPRETLEDMFIYVLGMISKNRGYVVMNPQEIYDTIVAAYNQEVGGER